MLIRMMGEDEAKSMPIQAPVHNVPAWGKGIAWAYYKGYTKGTSATKSAQTTHNSTASSFTLRAMGTAMIPMKLL